MTLGGLLYPLTPQEVRDNIGTAITTLYNAGGRTFLVPNLPPLGDKPNFLNTEYQKPANDFVVDYNRLLHTKLSELRQTLSGITIIEFDVYALFQDVLNDPGKYGLTNVTEAAFNDNTDTIAAGVDHYLFWDGTHPTRAGHAIVGESAYKLIVSALGLPPGQSQP